MFYRKLFILAASALSFLSSVETPDPGGVLVAEPCLPVVAFWADNPDLGFISTPTKTTPIGEYVVLRPAERIASANNTSTPVILTLPRMPIFKINPLGLSIDLADLEKAQLVYTVTAYVVRRLRRKTGVAGWRLLANALKGVLVLSVLALRVALGLDEPHRSFDIFFAEPGVRAAVDRLAVQAKVSIRSLRRVARYASSLIKAENVLFLVTCLDLPRSTPLTLHDLVDFDKVILAYVVTLHFIRRLHARTGVPWWTSMRDASRAVFVLGGIAVKVGFGHGDEECRAVVDLLRPGVTSFYRRARFSARKCHRVVHYGLIKMRSVDVSAVMMYIPLPIEVPLVHLFSALVLDGVDVSILAARFTVVQTVLDPPPTPQIRRKTSRYKRSCCKGKAKSP